MKTYLDGLREAYSAMRDQVARWKNLGRPHEANVSAIGGDAIRILIEAAGFRAEKDRAE